MNYRGLQRDSLEYYRRRCDELEEENREHALRVQQQAIESQRQEVRWSHEERDELQRLLVAVVRQHEHRNDGQPLRLGDPAMEALGRADRPLRRLCSRYDEMHRQWVLWTEPVQDHHELAPGSRAPGSDDDIL